MAKLSELLDRVLDEYPAVPSALALRALSDAAKEFCSRTHAWQETMSTIRVHPGVREYEIDLDPGVQLVAIKEVRLDGARIEPIATDIYHLRRDDLRAGLPLGWVQWMPTTIELVNPPSESVSLTVKAALTLALNAVEVDMPDSILDEYGDAISSGAKGRLARQKGQPWSDPDAVIAYMGPFYTDVARAKQRVNNALGEAQRQVQMTRW